MNDKNFIRQRLHKSQWYIVYSLIIMGFVGVLFFDLGTPLPVRAQTPSGSVITNTTSLDAGEVLRVKGGEIHQVAFSPRRDPLTAGTSGLVAVAATSAGLWMVSPNNDHGAMLDPAPMIALWWSPNGNLLAAETSTGTVQIWQIPETTVKLSTLQNKTSRLVTAAWSPNGSQLATGAEDGTIEIWKSGGTLDETKKGHTAHINSLVWSADGTLLVSGAQDGSVRVWTVNTATSTGAISQTGTVSQTEPLSQTGTISQTAKASPTPAPAAAQAIIQVDSLNIRSGPATTYAKVGGAKLNDRLTVIGQVNACVWLQIQMPNGGQGWIAGSAQFVTLSTPCDSIPPATNAPTNASTTPAVTAPAGGNTPTATPAQSTAPAATINPEKLPDTQGCYLFQNQLGAELNVTITRTDTNQSTTFKVPSGQATPTPACLEPGHYSYTVDAPPPWASINGELDVKAGDRYLIPVKAQ